MLSFQSPKVHMEKLYSAEIQRVYRDKEKDGERFLQKERERVRGDYIPCDKPVL